MKAITAVALAASMLIAGCGGGTDVPSQTQGAEALTVLGAAAAAQRTSEPARRHALATSDGPTAEQTAQLFALAESSFATYFPSKRTTRSYEGWAYRYYPETGIYLAVIGSGVYVLGGVFGVDAMRVGAITDFLGQPPAIGKDRQLTAAILAQCPDAWPGSNSPSFYQCMIGRLTGTQKFNTSKSCSLEITETGVLTLSSDGKSVTVGPQFGTVFYSKYPAANLLSVTVSQPGGGFVGEIKLPASTKFSFSSGGTVDVEATEPGTSTAGISCTLSVPK